MSPSSRSFDPVKDANPDLLKVMSPQQSMLGTQAVLAITPAAVAAASAAFEDAEPAEHAGGPGSMPLGGPVSVLIDGVPAEFVDSPPMVEAWAPDWQVKRVWYRAPVPVTGPSFPTTPAKREVLVELWVRPGVPWIPGAVVNCSTDGAAVTVEIGGGILPPTLLYPGAGFPLMLGAPGALASTLAIPCVAHDVYPGGIRGPDQAYTASPGSPRNCFNPKFLAALSPDRFASDPQGAWNDLAAFVRYVGFQVRRNYQRAPTSAASDAIVATSEKPGLAGFDLLAYHQDQGSKLIDLGMLTSTNAKAWPKLKDKWVPDQVRDALAQLGVRPDFGARTVPGAKWWPREQVAVIDPKTFAPGVRGVDAWKSTHLEVGELLGGWLRTRHPMAYDQARRVVLGHALFEWDVGLLAGGGMDFGDNTRRKGRSLESLGRMLGAAKVAGDDATYALCDWIAKLQCERILDLWDSNPAQPDPKPMTLDVDQVVPVTPAKVPWITMSGSTGSLDDRHLLEPGDCAYFVGVAAFGSGLIANKGAESAPVARTLRDRILAHLEADWWIPAGETRQGITAGDVPVWFLDLPATGILAHAKPWKPDEVGDGTFRWLNQGFELAGKIGSPFYVAMKAACAAKGKPIEPVGTWAF